MSQPAATLVLPADSLATIERTLAAVRAQRRAGEIELVLAWMGEGEPRLEPEGLHSARTVLSPGPTLGEARAEGARMAAAPLVAFLEPHSWPAPGWAEAMLDRFDEQWIAVGPAMTNGNDESSPDSWATMLCCHGDFVAHPGGRSERLAGHNTWYRRETLLGFGSELHRLLDVEPVLCSRLGAGLCVEPAAEVRHHNLTEPGAAFRSMYHVVRLYGGERSARWTLRRRAIYVAATPLLLPMFVARAFRNARRAGAAGQLLRGWRLLLTNVIAGAAGEAVAYAAGPGRAAERAAPYELRGSSSSGPK